MSYTPYTVSKSVVYTLYRRSAVSPAFNCSKMAWVAGLGLAAAFLCVAALFFAASSCCLASSSCCFALVSAASFLFSSASFLASSSCFFVRSARSADLGKHGERVKYIF